MAITYSEYKRLTNDEVVGRRVVLRQDINIGWLIAPKGLICTITRKFNGYEMIGDPCPKCGVRVRMKRVPSVCCDFVYGEENG